MGTGGAPEGVIAAAALRCVGGDMQGRLLFRDDPSASAPRGRACSDLDRIWPWTPSPAAA